MTYIATFYSHFGAIRCKKLCEAQGLSARAMPVPRNLSSSCGTCVRWGGRDSRRHAHGRDGTDRPGNPIGL